MYQINSIWSHHHWCISFYNPINKLIPWALLNTSAAASQSISSWRTVDMTVISCCCQKSLIEKSLHMHARLLFSPLVWQYIVQSDPVLIYSTLLHRSDMTHNLKAGRNDSHVFGYFSGQFQAFFSCVGINLIWMGYMPSRLPPKHTDWTLPCLCKSCTIENAKVANYITLHNIASNHTSFFSLVEWRMKV